MALALITQAEIERAIGEKTLRVIADDDKDGVADPDVVAGAIAEASSLCASYTRDFATTGEDSPALKRAAISIAVQFLRLPRDRSTEDSRRAYDAAIQWLRDVGAGKAELSSTPPAESAIAAPDAPEAESADRIWDRSTASRVL